MIQIPVNHASEVRDLLARWQVIQKAAPFDWDDEIGGSWHRPPPLPRYAPLVDALVQAGMDPHAIWKPDHDEAIRQLRHFASGWTLEDAAAAFVAGLWSAPAAWRSAPIGFLIDRVIPEHPFTPGSEDTAKLCPVCGYEADHPRQVIAEWSFRLTEGTPLDGEVPGYAQVFAWLGDGRPEPTEYDRWALGAILAVIRSLPLGTRYSAAAKAIKAAGILQGARLPGKVLEDLALIGVLAPETHPGMWERFTTYRERDQRPTVRVEVQAPLAWWDTSVSDHGVRTEVFEAVFGSLDVPAVDLDGPRPAPSPGPKDTLMGGLAARERAFTPKETKAPASIGSGPVAAGDVWAIRLRPGIWVTAYVHEVRERGRPYANTEYLAGIFPDCPAANDLSDQVQPRYDGRSAMWVHSIEKTPWIRRVAAGLSVPKGDQPRPEGGSWQAAGALRHLAGWHFDLQ
jgi:hypothetical protein